MKTPLLIIMFLTCIIARSYAQISLPEIISDNMVLQQKNTIKLWGSTSTNAEVKVEASWGAKASVKAGADGKWLVSISTPAYGGPYELKFTSNNEVKVIKNVLIGEVWLCSGQSNMEMPLMGWPPKDTIFTARKEIPQANNPNIRFFSVARNISTEPLEKCTGNWSVCDQNSAALFSATGYFFGKKLYNETKIPVGLINSSWGGTPAESWVSLNNVSKIEGFESFGLEIEDIKASSMVVNNFLEQLKKRTISSLPSNAPYKSLDINDSKYSANTLNISTWKEMSIPSLWDDAVIPGFDGIVWLIRDFDYDGETGDGLEFYLGTVDDMDVSYLNGTKIGGIDELGFYNMERVYKIPANLLKKGKNRIAIKVIDAQGGGGIYGKNSPAIKKGEKIVLDLGGMWKYLPVALFRNLNIYEFEEGEKAYDKISSKNKVFDAYKATSLYNAMISPLINYTIKGAIWYQGESNVGRGGQYEKLFPELITCWRNAWKIGNFPFYFVQIAPYNYGPESNEAVSALRNAQTKTLSLPNTGMAVTMDIGNAENIHPGNKKDVGERLALWAIAKNYGKKNLIYSGPILKKASFNKDIAIIEFLYAESGLKLKGTDNFFEIAGADGLFFPAEVSIKGNKIELSSKKVSEASQVRYAWIDDCTSNLFNGAGLPASPFIAKK